MYKATVIVMMKPEVLDPQGAAVERAVGVMGFGAVSDVRIGKHIEMFVHAGDKKAAEALAREMADKLLANPNIENYRVIVEEASR